MRKLLVVLLVLVLAVTSVLTTIPEAKAFTRVSTLTLNADENIVAPSVIDSAGGFAYFAAVQYASVGTIASSIVVKVRLSDFTRVNSLTLKTGNNIPVSAVIDTAGGFAYFGTVRVRLSNFTRVDSLTLNPGESTLVSAVIYSAARFAYFGTVALPPGTTNPAVIVKVRLSDFTRVDSLTLNTGESYLSSAVIDSAGGFAYFGTFTFPGIIVKVRLSDFTRVDSLTLNTG